MQEARGCGLKASVHTPREMTLLQGQALRGGSGGSASSPALCCPRLALESEGPCGKHPRGLDDVMLVKEGQAGGFTKNKTPHQPLTRRTPRGLGAARGAELDLWSQGRLGLCPLPSLAVWSGASSLTPECWLPPLRDGLVSCLSRCCEDNGVTRQSSEPQTLDPSCVSFPGVSWPREPSRFFCSINV